jgi:hypothetical protein
MDWQKHGEKSEWVMAATPPCVSEQGKNPCGPWKWTVGDGFSSSSPSENSIGFVVLKDEMRSSRPQSFQAADFFSPDPSTARFEGKSIYSSIYRSVVYNGALGAKAVYIKTMHVQPVIYRMNRTPLTFAAKDIPITVGEKVSIEVPASTKDAKLIITSISGDWILPLERVSAQERYGVLRVDEVERGIVTTKVTLTVWPH